ncbi:MAG TPA: DUF3108 domain-containing protein [Pyrinomonadaceae bacterium]|nr:DUF3108 domain-containing protein [Pyrinomonadaceae bacterium]
MIHRAVTFVFAIALACAFTPARGVFAHGDDDEGERAKNVQPLPFEPTETLAYDAEFSKLMLRGIKIAEFTFTAGRAPDAPADASNNASASNVSAKQAASADAPRLLFVGDVSSNGWFSKLFKIDFHFRVESLVERAPFSVVRTTKLDEQGKRVRRSDAVFDRAGKVVSWTEIDPNDPNRQPRVVTSPLEGAAHDIVSAIYFLRTQRLAHGQTFELTLSDSGQVYKVPARVSAERKAIKTVIGKVKVLRVDVELFGEGRPVQGEGKMSLWVTDDARRVPVRAKLSSKLGTLDIKLKAVNSKS